MWSPQITCDACQTKTRQRFGQEAISEGWVAYFRSPVNQQDQRLPAHQLTEPASHHVHVCPECVLRILADGF